MRAETGSRDARGPDEILMRGDFDARLVKKTNGLRQKRASCTPVLPCFAVLLALERAEPLRRWPTIGIEGKGQRAERQAPF